MILSIGLPFLGIRLLFLHHPPKALNRSDSPIMAILLYTVIGLGIIPFIYITFFARGKRVFHYYTAGEFFFRSE